jgi:predicted O-methyltransferase YrrM
MSAAPFRWSKKILRAVIGGLLRPGDDDHLVQGLAKIALDVRRGQGKQLNALNVFFQYATAASFMRNLRPLGRVLELGTGYSTLLYARLLPPEVVLVSLDAKPLADYDIGLPLSRLTRRVRFERGFTITRQELAAFHEAPDRESYAGVPATALATTAAGFVRAGTSSYATHLNLPPDRDPAQEALQRLFPGGRLAGLARLLPKDYAAEAAVLPASGQGALAGLLAEPGDFDAVFLDCGEFSTAVEWLAVRQRIRIGGLAVFHDIYFPKSVKSFLPCAAMAASSDWRILYQDRSTPQGLLVAERLA